MLSRQETNNQQWCRETAHKAIWPDRVSTPERNRAVRVLADIMPSNFVYTDQLVDKWASEARENDQLELK